MDTTQNPQGGTGVGNPTNPSSNGVGGAADDLDARLNVRLATEIEKVASGFRSVVDRRVSGLERTNQALAQELQATRQALGQIQAHFTTAQEAELDPDERRQRQDIRTQQQFLQERQQLILNARQQNAAFKVALAIQELGYKWGDERFDWDPETYKSDPDGWASTVILNASRRHALDLQEAQRTRSQSAQDAVQTHAREVQAAQRVEENNAQRQAQAIQTSTAVPNGTEADWMQRVNQMTPEEKRAWIRRTQHGITHGEITHPSQSR